MRETINKVLEFQAKNKAGKKRIVGKMEIRAKAGNKKRAELYIYGTIVSDGWKWDDSDVAPSDVRDFLKEIEDAENLDIYINSPGGSVFAGMAIYNILKRFKGYKTVRVDGLAASMASIIALAGDRIIIPANAYYMIHKAWSWAVGNADDFRKMAETLDKIDESSLNVYKEHLRDGVDIETIRQMVAEETWMTGEEAAQYFDIEVDEANEAAACVDPEMFAQYRNVPEKLKAAAQSIETEQLIQDLVAQEVKRQLGALTGKQQSQQQGQQNQAAPPPQSRQNPQNPQLNNTNENDTGDTSTTLSTTTQCHFSLANKKKLLDLKTKEEM